jgi:hypothetical protein
VQRFDGAERWQVVNVGIVNRVTAMGLALVALAVGVVLLYYWLLGHWFARALTFLAFAMPLGFLGACYAHDPIAGLFGMAVGGTAAWFLAGIPIYVRRRRPAQIATEA